MRDLNPDEFAALALLCKNEAPVSVRLVDGREVFAVVTEVQRGFLALSAKLQEIRPVAGLLYPRPEPSAWAVVKDGLDTFVEVYMAEGTIRIPVHSWTTRDDASKKFGLPL